MGEPPLQQSIVRSGILRALEAAGRVHPTRRKRLIAPDVNYGRELLVTLARATGGWIGWEATNLRGIAEGLAFVPLSEQGLRAGSDIEIGALLNRALDRAIAGGRVGPVFVALERSLGFRRALRDALLELRTAGVGAEHVRGGAPRGSPAHDLSALLEEYESLLAASSLTDPAGIFRAATENFHLEAPYVLDGVILLAPSLGMRGVPGRLVELLIEHGAQTLASDPVIGMDTPAQLLAWRVSAERPACGAAEVAAARSSILAWLAAPELPAADDQRLDQTAVEVDLFAADTPLDELLGVCRRVMAEGLRWDDVEIVATDVDSYGIALDSLCQRLGFGATMLRGVPLARTRVGRALDRWLAWLEGGLPADVLRQALEAGELQAPGSAAVSTVLARELRICNVGWGRARCEAALAALDADRLGPVPGRREDESESELLLRRELRARSRGALAALLRALLGCTPEVPERGSDRKVRSSCSALARATLGWLALVPLRGMPEEETAKRLRERLQQVAGVDDGEVPFAGALAALRDSLADLRAWPLVADEPKAWSSAGGMPHLTDIAHAGTTGRVRTFVVGLDANRTLGGGASRQDPLLSDGARRAIAGVARRSGVLPTSGERREEAEYALAAALGSLRGRVTLSYAAAGARTGRDAGPSAVLLQAWRLIRRDATLSYEELRETLRPPASAVPDRVDGALDGGELFDHRDVWFDTIADGALLLDGGHLVRSAFPGLDAGLRSMEVAAAPEPGAYQGIVPLAAGVLDPTAHAGTEISPSSLERLSACPLAWFYRYGLSLRLPEDHEYDAEQWLDALQRGALLHELFESFGRAYQDRQDELGNDDARVHMLAIAADAIERWRERVPPPGEAVFESEADELRRAAIAFLQMERDLAERGEGGQWKYFEYGFGAGMPSGPYPLGGGRALAVRGRADRVDVLRDGTLRVVDYKTGKADRFAKRTRDGVFNGGRRLQPALYAAALGALIGAPVSRFEYRFPTERGRNEIVTYTSTELRDARDIVDGLLRYLESGSFIPTSDSDDCGYCDYQSICRARRVGYKTESPRAAWAAAHAPELPVYETMLRRRGTPGDPAATGGAAGEDRKSVV